LHAGLRDDPRGAGARRAARARGRACILGIGDRAARIRERLARFVTSFDVPIS